MLFATTKNINKTSFFVARGGVFILYLSIMTPKNKAKQIYDSFDLKPEQPIFIMSKNHVVECCLKCIDEISIVINDSCMDGGNSLKYWQKVKEEIKKL